MKNKNININIEILRIISMMMIIILHLLKYGGILLNNNLNQVQNLIISIIEALCIVAVNVFILISGYFLVDKPFKFEKIIRLILNTFFYSAIIGATLMITGEIEFSIRNLAIILFPNITEQYWFISAYIYLYLLHPFINIVINNLNRRQLFSLIMILITICSVIGMINVNTVSGTMSGMSIVWFICLYLSAAYIKKYGNATHKIKLLTTYLILACFLAFSVQGIDMITSAILGISKYQYFLYHYNSPIVYIMSICMFKLFVSFKKSYSTKLSKVICYFSSSTLIVYILHENYFLRKFIWESINPSRFINSNYLYLYSISTVLTIFIIGTVIAKILQFVFDKLYEKIIFDSKICRKLNTLINEEFKGESE